METVFYIGLIFLLSGFVQGMTGFGSALVAIPLLCLIIDIKFAIPLSALNGLIITSFLAYKLKSHLNLKNILPLCLATLPGIVVGVTLLKKVPSQTVALLLGTLIICYSIYNLFFQPRPRNIHDNWAYVAGFCAGAIGSAFSAGGPPVILYSTMKGWDKNVIKATLTGFFLFNSSMTVFAHVVTGLTTKDVFAAFLTSWPFVLVGTIAGSACYGYLRQRSYLRILYILLFLMGAMMLRIKL